MNQQTIELKKYWTIVTSSSFCLFSTNRYVNGIQYDTQFTMIYGLSSPINFVFVLLHFSWFGFIHCMSLMLGQMWNDLGIFFVCSQHTKRFWIVIQRDFITTSYLLVSHISHLAVHILKISPQNTKWLMTAKVKSNIRVQGSLPTATTTTAIHEKERKIEMRIIERFLASDETTTNEHTQKKRRRLERVPCTVHSAYTLYALKIVLIVSFYEVKEKTYLLSYSVSMGLYREGVICFGHFSFNNVFASTKTPNE